MWKQFQFHFILADLHWTSNVVTFGEKKKIHFSTLALLTSVASIAVRCQIFFGNRNYLHFVQSVVYLDADQGTLILMCWMSSVIDYRSYFYRCESILFLESRILFRSFPLPDHWVHKTSDGPKNLTCIHSVHKIISQHGYWIMGDHTLFPHSSFCPRSWGLKLELAVCIKSWYTCTLVFAAWRLYGTLNLTTGSTHSVSINGSLCPVWLPQRTAIASKTALKFASPARWDYHHLVIIISIVTVCVI